MRVQDIEYEISIGFSLKGPTREFDFCNVFNKSLHGLQFYECSSYQDSTVFMNLQNFYLKFRYNPSKIIEEFIFPLFLIISLSVLVIIETSIKKMWLKQVIKETKMKKKFI